MHLSHFGVSFLRILIPFEAPPHLLTADLQSYCESGTNVRMLCELIELRVQHSLQASNHWCNPTPCYTFCFELRFQSANTLPVFHCFGHVEKLRRLRRGLRRWVGAPSVSLIDQAQLNYKFRLVLSWLLFREKPLDVLSNVPRRILSKYYLRGAISWSLGALPKYSLFWCANLS